MFRQAPTLRNSAWMCFVSSHRRSLDSGLSPSEQLLLGIRIQARQHGAGGLTDLLPNYGSRLWIVHHNRSIQRVQSNGYTVFRCIEYPCDRQGLQGAAGRIAVPSGRRSGEVRTKCRRRTSRKPTAGPNEGLSLGTRTVRLNSDRRARRSPHGELYRASFNSERSVPKTAIVVPLTDPPSSASSSMTGTKPWESRHRRCSQRRR